MDERDSAETKIRKIRRKTRWKYSTSEKIHIVLKGMRGDQSITELCHREGINQNLYYLWRKEFLEAVESDLNVDMTRFDSDEEIAAKILGNKQLLDAVEELAL